MSGLHYSQDLADLVDRLRDAGYGRGLSRAEELFWVAAAQRGEEDAKLVLLGQVIRSMVREAGRWSRIYGADIEDCFQVACLAFEQTIKRFDETKKARFLTYLTWWIQATVQRSCIEDRLIHVPAMRGILQDRKMRDAVRKFHEENGVYPNRDQLHAMFPSIPPVTLDYYEARVRAYHMQSLNTQSPGERRFFEVTDPAPSLNAWMERIENVARVRAALRKMKSRRCAMILERRAAGAVLGDISKEMGLTRERVRQLEAKGLKALSKLLGGPVEPKYSLGQVHAWAAKE